MRNKQKILTDLVTQARQADRGPVKTHFNDHERAVIKGFFERRKRSGTARKESFLYLCGLLGELLDPPDWGRVFAADKVGNLPFFLGGHRERPDREREDWSNKCFGLAENSPGVFVVGLNQFFYSNVTTKELLPPD